MEAERGVEVDQLYLWIRGISLMIYRRLWVCSDSSLADLHDPHEKQPGGISLLGDLALAAPMPWAELAVTPQNRFGGLLAGHQSLRLGQCLLKVWLEVGDWECVELFLDIHNAPDRERRALNGVHLKAGGS